jgi:hypothetical protein
VDNPIDKTGCQDTEDTVESERDRQHFDKEFMKAYIEDLKERGELGQCKNRLRAGEMAQWLRALTALLKVLCSNPSNHMVAYNHP